MELFDTKDNWNIKLYKVIKDAICAHRQTDKQLK